jgi:hypothetical protein
MGSKYRASGGKEGDTNRHQDRNEERQYFEPQSRGRLNGLIHACSRRSYARRVLNELEIERQREGGAPVGARTARLMCAWSASPDCIAICIGVACDGSGWQRTRGILESPAGVLCSDSRLKFSTLH